MLGEDYSVDYADPSGVLLAAKSVSGVCGVIEMAPWENTVDWQESVLVAFEHGYVKVELPAPLASQLPGRVTVMKDNKTESGFFSPFLPKVSAMRNQAKNFVSVALGEKEPPCGSVEALRDLEIARDYINAFYKG